MRNFTEDEGNLKLAPVPLFSPEAAVLVLKNHILLVTPFMHGLK